jgi:hypothetical protein
MDDGNGNTIMTSCPRLARSQGELFTKFVAVFAGHAYFVDGQNLKGELIGPMGTAFDVIASAQTSMITAATAAATTDAIYFADADPSDPTHGFIEETPLAPNSVATVIARGQNAPIAIAADAKTVFWANADCSIWSQTR